MTFKLNDKVYDPAFGFGLVTKTYPMAKAYQLQVTFSGEDIITTIQDYTLDGRYFIKGEIRLINIDERQ